MIEEKKLLFLGGGRSNINAIKSALELGLRPYVLGLEGDYPGYKLANKTIVADTMDKRAVLKSLNNEEIDGVLVCCSDRAIETVGFLNDQLRLNGITESAAKRCNNKYEMKRVLIDKGVNTAKFIKVEKEADLKNVFLFFTFPVMVKAVDLQSSRGIYICNNQRELIESYGNSIIESKFSYCIVEEFIRGDELGAQAFVYNGEIVFVLPHGDIIAHKGKSTIPIGHYVPLICGEELYKRIIEESIKAINALELNNCAVNIDFIVKDGIPYVLELSGRVGANCLPEMVSYHFGINYYKMIIAVAVGEDPIRYFKPNTNKKFTFVKMIKSDKSGLLNSIAYDHEMLPYVSFFVEKGDKIHAFKSSSDCIGEMLCQGGSLKECEYAMDVFTQTMKIELR